jgi:hypothetical protein
LTLVNATVSHNTADGSGGGFFNNNGVISLTYATVASNTATSVGRGIYNAGGVVTAQNTLVAHNGATNCSGALHSDGHNLESGTTCGFTATSDITGTVPLLGPLTDEGGIWVHPLLGRSPAIDAGLCRPGVTTIDQRGVTRPQGDRCDIGAYESTARAIYLPLVVRE